MSEYTGGSHPAHHIGWRGRVGGGEPPLRALEAVVAAHLLEAPPGALIKGGPQVLLQERHQRVTEDGAACHPLVVAPATVVVRTVEPAPRDPIDQPAEECRMVGVHPEGDLCLAAIPPEVAFADEDAHEEPRVEPGDGAPVRGRARLVAACATRGVGLVAHWIAFGSSCEHGVSLGSDCFTVRYHVTPPERAHKSVVRRAQRPREGRTLRFWAPPWMIGTGERRPITLESQAVEMHRRTG